ncbi:MAG: hypothetical protein MJ105_00955 [Lachnospiraceae bacterium]|nr:hypothetical protein [Lachnospiraceae bacterium]
MFKKNIFKQSYSKPVLNGEDGNDKVYEMITQGKPFMAGRFGSNEIRVIADVLYEKAGGKFGGLSDEVRFKITNQAGFFPDDREQLYRFQELFVDCCSQVDLIGVWEIFLQDEINKRFLPDAAYSVLETMEPYYYEKPWSRALLHKKVLVIHPFAETIEKQYQKREVLFANKDILPEFELRTVKAVQTIAGQKDERYATWFEALEDMYAQAMEQDFDIALIGCGAYGFPLAAKIKAAGKQAVHMGGALQLLFGIKGRRWDNFEPVSELYNDAWVRPAENEKVQKSDVVEESCYW